MGRRTSSVQAFVDWRERLRRYESSGLSIDAFCRQEEVSRNQFAQWLRVLREAGEGAASRSPARPAFVPVTVKASFIEILLPGGGLVRLSAGIDRTLLLDVIRLVSTVLEESRS